MTNLWAKAREKRIGIQIFSKSALFDYEYLTGLYVNLLKVKANAKLVAIYIKRKKMEINSVIYKPHRMKCFKQKF